MKSLRRPTLPLMHSRACSSGVLGVAKGFLFVLFGSRSDPVVAAVDSESEELARHRKADVEKVKRSAGRLEKMVEDMKADRWRPDG